MTSWPKSDSRVNHCVNCGGARGRVITRELRGNFHSQHSALHNSRQNLHRRAMDEVDEKEEASAPTPDRTRDINKKNAHRPLRAQERDLRRGPLQDRRDDENGDASRRLHRSIPDGRIGTRPEGLCSCLDRSPDGDCASEVTKHARNRACDETRGARARVCRARQIP